MKNIILYLFISVEFFTESFGQIKPVEIDERCPDVTMHLINYKNQSAKISDFQGKLLILDFWATWCGPCLASFPKIDSLQKEFGDRIQILPVAYEKGEAISQILKKLKDAKDVYLPSVVNDNELRAYFPHSVIPNCVWIDSAGKVIAITDGDQLKTENIHRILNRSKIILPKATATLNLGRIGNETSLFTPALRILDDYGNLKSTELLKNDDVYYKSILTKHKDGLLSQIGLDDSSKIAMSNVGIEQLMMFAYLDKMEDAGLDQIDFGYGKRIWDVQDPEILLLKDSAGNAAGKKDGENAFRKWQRDNTFCYELQMSKSLGKRKFYETMRHELNNYFGSQYGINTTWEKRKQKCLALIKLGGEDKIKTKGDPSIEKQDPFSLTLTNEPIKEIAVILGAYFFSGSSLPFVDETSYKQNVDISFTCDMHDLKAINEKLAGYNLSIIEKDVDIDIIVFRQRKTLKQ